MSRLNELIQKLCPDGVEFPILNTICCIYDGTHQTPNYTEVGVKFVSVENIGNLYGSTKYISREDYLKYKIKPQKGDILMTRIGSIGICAVIEKNEELAYYVSLALLRPNSEFIDSRYLKYAIESLHGRKELRKRTLVNAVPIKVNMGDIGKITIPLPPLAIQHEIVHILDSFMLYTVNITRELSSELVARKKQYEYYREKLLIGNRNNIKWSFFGEECELKAGKAIKSLLISDMKSNTTNIPCYGGNGLRGYVEMSNYEGDYPIIGRQGALCGNVCYASGKFYATEHAVTVKAGENYLPRFLYHLLSASNLNQYKTAGAQPGLSVEKLSKVKLPVPSIETQKKIIEVLDNFDAICTKLNIGLPAEIEARKKQYEYYRDMLLTFVESGNIIPNGTERNGTERNGTERNGTE